MLIGALDTEDAKILIWFSKALIVPSSQISQVWFALNSTNFFKMLGLYA